MEMRAYAGLGSCTRQIGELITSLNYYQQYLSIALKIPDHSAVSKAHCCLGQLLLIFICWFLLVFIDFCWILNNIDQIYSCPRYNSNINDINDLSQIKIYLMSADTPSLFRKYKSRIGPSARSAGISQEPLS